MQNYKKFLDYLSFKQQKIMQIFMPLFIGYISLNFPSGLVIYWIVSNVFQLVQQHFIYKGLEANK